MKRAILLLALIAAPILLLPACSPPEFLKGNQREVTVHLMRCDERADYGMKRGSRCEGTYLPVFVMHFKLFLNEQTVVDKTAPRSYRNCAVYDEDNWRCKYDEGTADFPGDFSMDRGNFHATWMWEYSAPSQVSKIEYVHVSWLNYTLWEWYLYFTR